MYVNKSIFAYLENKTNTISTKKCIIDTVLFLNLTIYFTSYISIYLTPFTLKVTLIF